MSSALNRRTEASNGCEYIVVINLKLQKAQSVVSVLYGIQEIREKASGKKEPFTRLLRLSFKKKQKEKEK